MKGVGILRNMMRGKQILSFSYKKFRMKYSTRLIMFQVSFQRMIIIRYS